MRGWFVACGVLTWGLIGWGETPSPPREYEIKRNLVYATPADRELLLDAYVPKGEGPFPGVLVIHGGSWKTGDKSQLSGYAMKLAARGLASFAINYRLAPEFKHPCQIDDCRAALRWIEQNAGQYHVDADRLGAIGYSAGAHLAFLLGVAGDQKSPKDPVHVWKGDSTTGRRLRAVVAGGSPCDFTVVKEKSKTLVDFLGGTQQDVPILYVDASPRFYISEDDPPILFFHGKADALVTIKGPQIMVEEFKSKGVPAELVEIDRADHITAAMNRGAVEKAIDFLAQRLDAKSASAPPAGQ
ncbi:alpha/beta hydrolase [bacterium]|nr:alpha/beta hydrolase [bacterium]